MLAIFL